jgi:hypothetical protein
VIYNIFNLLMREKVYTNINRFFRKIAGCR